MSIIPTYPPLYKFSTTDKLMVWRIEIVPSTGFDIVTTYGQHDGKQIEKRATINAGKCKRTPLEQSILESNRRFKDKKEKENYQETAPTNTPPLAMRPMLAQSFNPDIYAPLAPKSSAYRMPFPLMVQPKLDGIRCVTYCDATATTTMFSRKGTPYENFPHIAAAIAAATTGPIYIDGELYTADLTFERINGLVRSQTLTTQKDREDAAKIKYYIYDLYDPTHPLLCYSERNALLRNIHANIHIVLVETIIANTIADIVPHHQHYVADGYEGIMLRDPNGPYEMDRRSKYLQKYKTMMEDEFPIVGFEEEEGGLIVFVCKTGEGRTFKARPRGTFELRHNMFEHGESFIGKQLTVIFQEYTELNVPRFPVGKAIRDYE